MAREGRKRTTQFCEFTILFKARLNEYYCGQLRDGYLSVANKVEVCLNHTAMLSVRPIITHPQSSSPSTDHAVSINT